MEEFRFSSPLLREVATLQQDTIKEIGFKLYPGALIMAAFLEDAVKLGKLTSLCPADTVVVELGAGICGFGALLCAAAGYQSISTDLSTVIPLLTANIERNLPALPTAHGSDSKRICTAATLCWGDKHDVDHLLGGIYDVDGKDIGMILGADIVYHEHLIDPLLDTLVDITSKIITRKGKSPPVVLSYVQRFKRAKAFFKKAKKYFDIEAIPVADVVDYDCLTWTLPKIQHIVSKLHDTNITKMHEVAPVSHDVGSLLPLTSASGTYAAYTAAVSSLPAEISTTDTTETTTSSTACAPTIPAAEAVTSDSDEEYRRNMGAMGVEEMSSSLMNGDGSEALVVQRSVLHALPVSESLPAYMYILRRRTPA